MTNRSNLLIWAVALGLGACSADNRAADAAAGAQSDTVADSTGGARPAATKRAPAQIRGIYLNAYASGSTKRLATLLALADSTEINTFVVDVKDEKGMRYRTALPHQKEIGGEVTMTDLGAVVDSIHAHGVWAVARIVVFKDPMLSKAKPEWSIKNPDGGLWQDKAGNTWVSAWDPNVWEYNIQIAEEVLDAGFDEIQFDYVRFPEPFPSLPRQIHPNAKGDRTDAIVAFLNTAKPRIHAKGAIMAADVFGLSPNDPADVQIGQQWEPILATADHVLPMTYPSHYLPTHLKGVPTPNRMPYETIFHSVGMGVIRANRLREAGVSTQARVIPWLQGFSAPWVSRNYPYGPEQAAAQMRGVYDVGLEDWIFWHPGSKYELISAAFEKGETAPKAKKFEPTAEAIAQADLVDRMGSKSAREKVAAKVKAAN
jgi:hypothetical protein